MKDVPVFLLLPPRDYSSEEDVQALFGIYMRRGAASAAVDSSAFWWQQLHIERRLLSLFHPPLLCVVYLYLFFGGPPPTGRSCSEHPFIHSFYDYSKRAHTQYAKDLTDSLWNQKKGHYIKAAWLYSSALHVTALCDASIRPSHQFTAQKNNRRRFFPLFLINAGILVQFKT